MLSGDFLYQLLLPQQVLPQLCPLGPASLESLLSVPFLGGFQYPVEQSLLQSLLPSVRLSPPSASESLYRVATALDVLLAGGWV